MKIDDMTVEDWVAVVPRRIQHLARVLTRRPGRWLFRYRAFSSERVPREGGFIIAPNHGCYFDGFFFAHGFQRTVRYMGKYQVFGWPVIGRLSYWAGGFPVREGEDGQPALEVARRILLAGHGLIMFMEGRLVRDEELGEPRSGVALLAVQTGVAVVPVAAYGNKPAWVFGRKRRPWRRPRTTVVWGEPMRFERVAEPSRELVAAVRDEIWAEVARLHGIACEIHLRPGRRPRTRDIPPRPEGGAARAVHGPIAPVTTGKLVGGES